MAGGDYVTPFLLMATLYGASAVLFWVWFRPLERAALSTTPAAIAAEPAD
jgi:hypothetical protein